MQQERRFSLQEASELLGDLREVLPRIREARNELLASSAQVGKKSVGNGGGSEGRSYWDAMRSLRSDIEHLNEEGIILRDPDSGLIDFPSERDGRAIFLCWKLGEDAIGYWHEEDSGFSGRKPLEPR